MGNKTMSKLQHSIDNAVNHPPVKNPDPNPDPISFENFWRLPIPVGKVSHIEETKYINAV